MAGAGVCVCNVAAACWGFLVAGDGAFGNWVWGKFV